MEYLIKINDSSSKAKNIINLLKSLAEDYDFLEIIDDMTAFNELSEEQENELDRRFEYVLKNPSEGKLWEEVEAKLLSK